MAGAQFKFAEKKFGISCLILTKDAELKKIDKYKQIRAFSIDYFNEKITVSLKTQHLVDICFLKQLTLKYFVHFRQKNIFMR